MYQLIGRQFRNLTRVLLGYNEVLARLHSFLGTLGENCSLLFQLLKVTHIGSQPSFSKSATQIHGFCIYHHMPFSDSFLPPSSTVKDSWSQTGLTYIIQDTLSTLRSANTLSSLSHVTQHIHKFGGPGLDIVGDHCFVCHTPLLLSSFFIVPRASSMKEKGTSLNQFLKFA